MKYSDAGGSSPPVALSSQPSPTAVQLATFSPFASIASSSGTMDAGPLGRRNTNSISSWSLLPAASLQPSEPAQTATESIITDSSVFGYPLLLESTANSASPTAVQPHGSQALSTNGNGQGDWASPTALGPALPIQRQGLPRPTGRRFVVRNVPTDIEGLDMLKFLKGLRGINGPHMSELNTKGYFHVAFSDLREAKQFVQWLSGVQPTWEIISRSPDQFNRETRLGVNTPANFDDLTLLTTYCGTHSSAQPSDIVAMVKPILDLVGNVHSIQEVHLSSPSRSRVAVHELVVRWYDTTHALNAVRALNGIRTEDFIIEAVPYHPSDTRAIHWSSEGPRNARRLTPPSGRFDNSPQPLYMSPGADPDSSPIHIPRRDSGEGARQINARKIWQGHDTRTTVMLRNVPFTMTWAELKNVLDLTSHGRFDFLYLRMDFEANQNVGYAFVNFVTPRDIIPFMEARSGQNWPGYPATRHENKLAEMSYATVQGKDALVDKFRNSPVILNSSDKRPKVFHTFGPRTGQEATFPPVNNFYTLSKGVDLGRKNGLYRVPPSRMESRQSGTRYYCYSDSLESPAKEGYPHEFSTPTRARDPNRNQIAITPPSALQQWNMIRDA